MSFNLNFAVNLNVIASHAWNAKRPVTVQTENGNKLFTALPFTMGDDTPGVRMVYDDQRAIDLLYLGDGLWHEVATA